MATMQTIDRAVYQGVYDDQVSAGANAATRALKANAQAVKENAEAVREQSSEVKKAAPSIEALNRKLFETDRLAQDNARANREYTRTIEGLRQAYTQGAISAEKFAEGERRALVVLEQKRAKAQAASQAMAQMYATPASNGATAAATALADRLNAAAAAAEKAARAQAQINAATGVRSSSAEDYAQRAADVQAYGRALDDLRAKYNPLFAAGRSYKQTLTEISQAEKVGAISASEAAAARARTKAAFAAQAEAMTGTLSAATRLRQAEEAAAATTAKAANSYGLARYQVQNLTAQVVDLGVQVSSGGGVLLPLIQQGPQAVDAVGGVSAALRIVGQVLTPQRVAVVAFAAAMVGAVVAAERQAAALATLSNRLRATRSDYESLAQMAEGAARAAAGNSAVSTADARVAAQTIAGSRNFGGTQAELQGLIELSSRLAVVMGTDTAEAAGRLATALNRPTAAAREMAESGLREMNEGLLRSIERAENQGRVVEAGRMVLDAYGRTAAEVARTRLQKSWEELSQAATRLWQQIQPLVNIIGGALASALAWVVDRVTSLVSAMASAARAVREFLGIPMPEQAAQPQRSPTEIALQMARQIGGRANTQQNLRDQMTGLRAGLPGANAEEAARIRDALRSLQEQYAGTTGAAAQFLRSLQQQTEAATAGDGAVRALREAQIQMREAGGGAAEQAAAMAEVQRRLNQELQNSVEETNRSISVIEAQSRAYETGAETVDQARVAEQARIDALRYAVAGTDEYARAVERLVYWRTQELQAQQRLRDNQAIQAQVSELAILQRQVELISASVTERNREIAAERERQTIIRENNGNAAAAETEIARQRIDGARAIADQTSELDRQNDAYRELSNFGTRAFDRIGEAVTQAFANGSISAVKFKDIAKAVFSEIIQLALRLSVINPLSNALLGTNSGTLLSLGGRAAAAGAGAGGGTGTSQLSGASSGATLLSGFPRYADGVVTSGAGSIYAPGYQASTGVTMIDSVANYNVVGGVSALQAGAGVASIAGGAYGVYSGLQTGGAGGYTQAAGGAVGVAGGVAGLAVASGATSAGGILAGSALGTAAAATAAWAPYVAAALIIASMLMPGPKQSNAAAGANINLSTGVVNLENSGKETDATAGARDQMVKLVSDTTSQLGKLLGVTASGVIGFELGQRDPSRVVLNGQQVGTAGVGDSQKLADILGKAILQSFAQAPGLQDVQKRILDAAGGNVDFAMNLLAQTKSLVDTFGSDALNPDRNPATRAIYDAAIQTGSIENVVAALKGANELTQAYGDALNTADALKVVGAGSGNIQKIASDLQWLFEVYKPLTGAAEQISALDQAIAASNRTYRDAIARATELGLATDVLATKQQAAAEKIRQSLRDSYDALLAEAKGMTPVTQAVGQASAIRANWNANALDYLAVGRDPNELYAAQMTAAFKDLDVATLERVVEKLQGLDEVAALFAQAALDAAKATEATTKAAAVAATAKSFDAQLREATGGGWVNQIIELSDTIAANADAYREAGRDPALLYAAQVKDIIDGLDADALATAAQYLQGLDGVAADFLSAAIQAAQAAQQLAAAAQIAADAADYDAKMRAAMGLDLVNTIVSIGNEIDKMAARYTAAGKDPAALYTAQVNAALQGQDEGTLAKTAAALQGINTSAASLATAALEQTIATNVANAQQEIRDQQERDRIAAAEQAARDAEQAQQRAADAAESAAREQEQAAQEAQRAAEQLAQAGQGIRDYINRLKSSPEAGYTPTQALANAQATYNTDLALAQGGNLDALGRITGSADALIEAAKAMYASGPQFVAIRDQIIAQLTALPAVQSADQQIIDQLAGVNTKLTTTNSSLGTTNSSLGTANSSLSGIGSSTSTSNTKLDAANAYLASIDTNNDGVVSIDEIKTAAQANIATAQQALTTAAQNTATNAAATKTSVDASKTAIDLGTAKTAEVKGEVTSNNEISVQIQQLNATLTAAATSSSGGFQALGTLLINLTKYTSAAAFNTMYSRPASVDPGIPISSALGNIFQDGALVTSPTTVPLSLMGEAGPEAVMPLQRGPGGRLGVAMWGGAANDNRTLERVVAAIREAQREHTRAMAGMIRMMIIEQRNTTSAVEDVRSAIKRSAA